MKALGAEQGCGCSCHDAAFTEHTDPCCAFMNVERKHVLAHLAYEADLRRRQDADRLAARVRKQQAQKARLRRKTSKQSRRKNRG